MARASEPVLAWLRQVLGSRSLNTAELAKKSGVSRSRLRRILLGTEPMLVDELFAITHALQISPADVAAASAFDPPVAEGGADGPSAPEPALTAIRADDAIEDDEGDGVPGIDPWGNQPEQLFRVAFALGCDLLFTAETAMLANSGVPSYVLQQYRDSQVPIELDAAFHGHNAPRYDPDGVTLTLSFDALYDCRFPWASIRRLVFSPTPPDPEEEPAPEPPKGRPRLRLVD